MCALMAFQIKINGSPARFLFQAVFPGINYTEGNDSGSFFENSAALVKQCLFPGAAYIYEQASGKIKIADEYYPSRTDLNRVSEENAAKVQENLEEQAEKENAAARESGADKDHDEDAVSAQAAVSSNVSGTVYPMSSLLDYNFVMNQFFIVDASTSCDRSVINPEVLLGKDLTMDLAGDEPKVLIYHTHSQETFADSVPGDEYGTVIGVYDMIDGVLDRSEAYSLALPVVEQILEENPSIKVVIDLHRDGVNEDTHLVTQINGKPTAQIMFFNGLCRSAASGTSGYIQNPYLTDNLAFSFQLQLKAAEKYPDFTRRIYLRSYRYNMHVAPRTLLVECGAQTNTVEEVQNAMEPLADILYSVLSGT